MTLLGELERLLFLSHLLPLLGLGGHAAGGGHLLLPALVEAADLLAHHLPPLLAVHLLPGLMLMLLMFLAYNVFITEG